GGRVFRVPPQYSYIPRPSAPENKRRKRLLPDIRGPDLHSKVPPADRGLSLYRLSGILTPPFHPPDVEQSTLIFQETLSGGSLCQRPIQLSSHLFAYAWMMRVNIMPGSKGQGSWTGNSERLLRVETSERAKEPDLQKHVSICDGADG